MVVEELLKHWKPAREIQSRDNATTVGLQASGRTLVILSTHRES